jgi:hypothetical protein
MVRIWPVSGMHLSCHFLRFSPIFSRNRSWFFREETTWEPEENLPSIAVKEYEEDMRELEVLARSDVPQKRTSRKQTKNSSQRPTGNPLSADVLQSKTWQARRKQRVEELLSRRLNQIKSIRLKDGTLEFLCVWYETFAFHPMVDWLIEEHIMFDF